MNTSGVLGSGAGWNVVALADLDLNGCSDIIWENAAGGVSVWFLGGTSCTSVINYNGYIGNGPGWKVVGAADLNRDGHPDLIWENPSGLISVWLLGGAQGTTPINTSLTIGSGAGWTVVGVADLNQDGHPDLIWENSSGSVSAWLLGGAQGFRFSIPSRLDPPLAGQSDQYTTSMATDILI